MTPERLAEIKEYGMFSATISREAVDEIQRCWERERELLAANNRRLEEKRSVEACLAAELKLADGERGRAANEIHLLRLEVKALMVANECDLDSSISSRAALKSEMDAEADALRAEVFAMQGEISAAALLKSEVGALNAKIREQEVANKRPRLDIGSYSIELADSSTESAEAMAAEVKALKEKIRIADANVLRLDELVQEQEVALTDRQNWTNWLQNESIAQRLNWLAGDCHRRSVEVGWYLDPATAQPLQYDITPAKLLEVICEVSEAAEGYRKGLMDDKLPHRLMVEVELADAVIRIMDLTGYLKLDLGGALVEKLAYNLTRADHKLEERAAVGGKKF